MGIAYKDIEKVNKEIKTVDIKGKAYAEVPQRVTAFRKLFPNGSLTSEIVYLEGGMVVIKATACDENGQILSTGLAYERENNGFINKTSFIENCETSAWGRCLAALGLGSDTSMASAEEVMNAQKQQKQMTENELKADLKKLLQETDSDVTAFLTWCSTSFKREIKAVDEMYEPELKEAIKTVKMKEKKK